MFNIIPAIDILANQVVRLTQGDYAQIEKYNFTPVELAKYYEEQGASRIHLVDLDGAKTGQLVNLKTFEKIRSTVKCELELGGGIRSIENADLLINLGINFLILGSMLIKNFNLAQEIINKYPSKIIAGIDVKNDKIAITGWLENSDLSLQSLLNKLSNLKIAAIIYTDISRDGMLTGPNIPGLTNICSLTKIPIIASGGVSSLEDIKTLQKLAPLGLIGVITGKALLQGKINIQNIFCN